MSHPARVTGAAGGRQGATGRLITLVATMLVLFAQPVLGQESKHSPLSPPAIRLEQTQNDAVFSGYRFRDGETLPQVRIHYVTLGHPHKDSQEKIDNAILLLHWTNSSSQALLTSEFQSALFGPGAPLDTSRYFIIIPDDIGHGRSSKPSEGLKAAFPHYGYGDMVDLQHRVVTESLGIDHLHAVIGMSMGCMNAWQSAEEFPDVMDGIMPVACFPAPISGRNLLWRRMLIDGIRSDPAWDNGNYQKQPQSALQGALLARMMIDGVPALQQEVPNVEAADALIRGAGGQSATDANDLLYAFESSRDFNAEPGLLQIKTKVFALNFADDEFYRDSLQILQRDAQTPISKTDCSPRRLQRLCWSSIHGSSRTFERRDHCVHELARGCLKQSTHTDEAIITDRSGIGTIHNNETKDEKGENVMPSANSANVPLDTRVLVTAATGHTGRPTVERLLEKGFEVRALVRKDDARAQGLRQLGAEVCLGDMSSLRDVRRALDGVNRAYFCCAIGTGWSKMPPSLHRRQGNRALN
jgi:homoserine O-acetyltransferase